LVGDVHGGVTLVKLSPNLTKGITRTPPAGSDKTFEQYEEEKMESILSVIGKFNQNDE